MGARPLLLTALLAAGLAAGCSGDGTPDPVPSPSPTRVATESPVTDDCPPITGAQQTVTIPRGATAPLPDGGSIRVAEVTPASGGTAAQVLLTRKVAGCPTDSVQLDFAEAGGGTVHGVKVDVVSVNTGGGMPPTVQVRFGPPD